jgi:flagellar basal-body rod protein FlgF
MDNAGYAALTRQAGLAREMQIVANNMANMSTTGFRREGLVFTEHVRALEGSGSLSMATAGAAYTSDLQGALTRTGRSLDLAIEGEGYFLVATPDGDMQTRAGSFVLNEDGGIVTADGMALLDAGGAPAFVPPGSAAISVAADGTLSADGVPIAQIGLWETPPPGGAERRAGTRFAIDGAPVPAAEGSGRIVQGFLESSNVSPVAEIARMIEVQRAYELGQSFLELEDARIRGIIQSFAR